MPISFNQDIRPILNQKCMSCHGGVKQQGGLSFLFEEHIYIPGTSGAYPIVKGRPKDSEVFLRITHENPELRMPLDAEPLTNKEVDLFEQWIAEGAKWERHWAFVSIENPAIPEVEDSWIGNEVDPFVFAKLRENNLAPSPEASEDDLLRRVYFDVIGLPPTLEEYNAYKDDDRENKYEQLIDHLLSSPHFGERWSSMWLDLARYADSQGFQKDKLRKTMWMYRDWVIKAFNDDMPFDQFTVEQLAGDLLPNATDQQLLATAFHRNTMTNDEGGTDDEEYRVQAVLDRTNTTMEIWQGLTFSCVQCHSHPYDPILHEEYYEVKSYFNNTQDHDHYSEFPTAQLLSQAQLDIQKTLERNIEQVNGTEVKAIQAKLQEIRPQAIPIMQEMPVDSNREDYVFVRGNWLMRGADVKKDVPQVLKENRDAMEGSRLELANWLVSPQNPLTSRVIVNRIWEQIFGVGLVETLEDFGTQGSPPSHPKLLDYLAYDFQHEMDWSVKQLVKKIVLSATYRQTSQADETAFLEDPKNIRLARGPRFRLSAEQLRDQALVASGLLSRTVYGPSVMPYQPDGVWNVIRHVAQWEKSQGADAYRRGLYTFWRRVSPYPSMITFDVPTREWCISRRIKTNTPLQALAMLNDPVFTEAAQALANLVEQEYPNDPQKQIESAYIRAALTNLSKAKEKILWDQYQFIKKEYDQQDDEINSREETDWNSHEAALFNICNTIMNLDEVITKR